MSLFMYERKKEIMDDWIQVGNSKPGSLKAPKISWEGDGFEHEFEAETKLSYSPSMILALSEEHESIF